MIGILALGGLVALTLLARSVHAAKLRPMGLIEDRPPDRPKPGDGATGPLPAPSPKPAPAEVVKTATDMARGKASAPQMRRAARSAARSGHRETARVKARTAHPLDEAKAAKKDGRAPKAVATVNAVAHPQSKAPPNRLRAAAHLARKVHGSSQRRRCRWIL